MPLHAFEAMKKLCDLSRWSLSNLELQKYLFLAQLEYMRTREGRLIAATFEAWDYGPVLPEIYRAVRHFGASPIANVFHALRYPPAELDRHLRESYARYRHLTPGQLVAATHRPNGAWDVNYESGVPSIIIPPILGTKPGADMPPDGEGVDKMLDALTGELKPPDSGA